jgi:hypothetical protein
LRSVGLFSLKAWLLAGVGFAAAAERDRLDLSEMRSMPGSYASPYGQIVVGFRPTDVQCPEEHGALEIKSGILSLHRLAGPRGFSLSELFRVQKPVDDNTWLYQVTSAECRLILTIRLQLKSDDDVWRPAILPALSRPSVTPEEKAAMLRDALARARKRAKVAPRPPPPIIRRSLGSDGSTSIAFGFDEIEPDKPQRKCFHAIGTYDLNPRHVSFTFFGELGELNRFTVERSDIDRYETRLNFIGGECRLQVTVGGLTWYHFDWAPLEID